MAEEAPLATYRERLPQVRRVLELYPDRVAARARWVMGGEYQQTIPLAGLRAEPRELWVRQRLFKRSLAIAALMVAVRNSCQLKPGSTSSIEGA